MRGWTLMVAMGAGLMPGMGRAEGPATVGNVEQMVQVFETVCLQAFPERRAVDGAMGQLGGTPLAAREVRTYLHDDPGRGWQLVRPEATYVVTIEEPPYRACAVRRMTPGGFPTRAPFDAAVQRYGAARKRALTPLLSQSMRPPSGLDIVATVQRVEGGGPGGSTDSLMLFTSDYHGTYDGPFGKDAGKPGIELRYVHQLRDAGAAP